MYIKQIADNFFEQTKMRANDYSKLIEYYCYSLKHESIYRPMVRYCLSLQILQQQMV